MKISKCTVHGRVRWRVFWRSAGRQHRRYFPTLEQARTAANIAREELERFGESFAALTAVERAVLVESHRRAQVGAYGLLDACTYYEQHHQTKAPGIELGELVARHLAAVKPDMQPNSYSAKRRTLEAFATDVKRAVRDVTADDIRNWINRDAWGNWRRRGALVDLKSLFNWAVAEGLLEKSPAAPVKRPNTDVVKVEILTPEQAAGLLSSVAKSHPRTVVPIALGLFAGMRTDEIQRAEWTWFKWDQQLIDVMGKGRRRRLVPMLPAMLAFVPKRTGGDVWDLDTRTQFDALKDSGVRWPRNALRHSFISYRVAATNNVAQVALEAGNSEDVIFKHYRELVTGPAAEKYFALRPVAVQ